MVILMRIFSDETKESNFETDFSEFLSQGLPCEQKQLSWKEARQFSGTSSLSDQAV